MKMLVERGADVNTICPLDGTTALQNAVVFGDPEAVRLLLSRGADVTAQNKKGETALVIAMKRSSESLPGRGKFRTAFGDLGGAMKDDYIQVVELLKDAGANK